MRLFIAIELPPPVREHLRDLQPDIQQAIGSGISLTRFENLHLTLKFLGETDDKTCAALTESLARVRSAGEMDLRCDRIECLPPRGPIRVIAASLGGDLNQLRSLHESIEQRCKFQGFAQEQRQFRPHVTIARAKGVVPSKARQTLIEMTASKMPGPDCVASEFVLIRSRLQSTGSEYTPLARFPL